MEYTRMSTKDMLQYCNEALAWEEFGPVDIFFSPGGPQPFLPPSSYHIAPSFATVFFRRDVFGKRIDNSFVRMVRWRDKPR